MEGLREELLLLLLLYSVQARAHRLMLDSMGTKQSGRPVSPETPISKPRAGLAVMATARSRCLRGQQQKPRTSLCPVTFTPNQQRNRTARQSQQSPYIKAEFRCHSFTQTPSAPSVPNPVHATDASPHHHTRCHSLFQPASLYRRPGPAACSFAAKAGYFSWTWICVLVASA